MKLSAVFPFIILVAAPAFAAALPYAGQQSRAIKALSAGEISGYLAGDGLGLARPAELNGYPGPRHVLDAAHDLGLTPAQETTLQKIFAEMHAAAVPLGQQLVGRETALDQLFASHRASETQLFALTREIGRLQGELRAVHLRAHLQTERLLTPQQVAIYNRLRGYSQPGALGQE